MLRWATAVAFILRSAAGAQQISVDFDSARTQIHWSLTGNVHNTHGTFQLKQGHLSFDPATGGITGDLVADASSGDSGNATRDKRMNKEILESEKFPEFRFMPHQVDGTLSLGGQSQVRVSGTFLMHGSVHSLVIPMDVSFTDGGVTGTGKFSIPYVDWGLKDPSNFFFKVDKSVEVEIVAIGNVALK